MQEYSTPSLSISEGFINASIKIKINTKLFLQGPMLNANTVGLMNDDLRIAGYIPTISPYSDTATCEASIFNTTGNDAIVDWVWVELRATNDNTKVINARSALLQHDGDIAIIDRTSNLVMNAAPTNYYVPVKHRNHLSAMSANTFGLSETPVVVDFTTSGFNLW